ncbi:MAG: hypothetical protein F6K08_16865 [Okeania sp. SIO1H6]|nr:hypothetical protein [Okeania sp. SIO1H6]
MKELLSEMTWYDRIYVVSKMLQDLIPDNAVSDHNIKEFFYLANKLYRYTPAQKLKLSISLLTGIRRKHFPN